MPTITFLSDPSLQRKGSRSRHLLVSAAKSHISKHGHEKRHSADPQQKRGGLESGRLRAYGLHRLRGSDSTSQTTRVPVAPKLKYSDYLEDTYGGNDEKVINGLFSYYIDVAGPLYVWDLVDTEDERSDFRGYMIRLFLTEPAFAEAILAWLQCFIDSNKVRTGTRSRKMLQHQTKSLSSIRKILEQPDKISDCSVLWCVVANLVTNQECGDWTSFEINLKGLNRIISILGGPEVLKRKNLRAHIFVQGLLKALSDRAVDAEVKPASFSRVASSQQHKQALAPTFQLPLGMPEELMTLCMNSKISYDIANGLKVALVLLGRFRRAKTHDAFSKDQKHVTESALLDLLHSNTLMFAEYTLCMGLLIKLATTPPFGDVREQLSTDLEASSLISAFRDMTMAADLERLQGPILWTCLVVMEMPLNIRPAFNVRLSLLQGIMLEVAEQPLWNDIRDTLAKIYLDAELEILWSKCWEKVLHQS